MDFKPLALIREIKCPICKSEIKYTDEYSSGENRMAITVTVHHMDKMFPECFIVMEQLVTEQEQMLSQMMKRFSQDLHGI